MFGCRHQPFALPSPLVDELAAAYSEPHRAYHNLEHIRAVLAWYDQVSEDLRWEQPREVYTAIVFHDAVYDPTAKDNEQRSAEWAKRSGLAVDLERVAQLIMLTAVHGTLASADRDAALFLDCDMSILGAPAHVFAAYDAAIAREYSHVAPDAYVVGRRAFLAKVAAKPRIFLSDYFHALLDEQARANLATALEVESPLR